MFHWLLENSIFGWNILIFFSFWRRRRKNHNDHGWRFRSLRIRSHLTTTTNYIPDDDFYDFNHIGCMSQLTDDVVGNNCSIHCRRCCQVSNFSWSSHGQVRRVTLETMESIHDDKMKSTLYQICHPHCRLV